MIIKLRKLYNIISIYVSLLTNSTGAAVHGTQVGMTDIFNTYSCAHTRYPLHWLNINTWASQSIYNEMYMLQDA